MQNQNYRNSNNNNRNFSVKLIKLINEIKFDYESCYHKSDYMYEYVDILSDKLAEYLNNYYKEENFELAEEYMYVRELAVKNSQEQFDNCESDFFDNIFDYYFDYYNMYENSWFEDIAVKYLKPVEEEDYIDPEDIKQLISDIYSDPNHEDHESVKSTIIEYFNEVYLGGEGDYFSEYDHALWAEQILYEYCGDLITAAE